METLRVYRCTLPTIITVALPFFIFSFLARFLAIKVAGASFVLLISASWAFATIATIKVLKIYLAYSKNQQFIGSTPISLPTFIFFVVAGLHIQFASLLSGVFLIIPGLVVYSSAFLALALVLTDNLGPFESIAESVERTQGNVWRIIALIISVWIALLIIELTLGSISATFDSQLLGYSISLLLTVIGLVPYTLMAVIFTKLEPNPSFQWIGADASPLELSRLNN